MMVQVASSKDSYVAAHCHGTEAIKLCIRCGVRTIEHCSLVDDEGIETEVYADTLAADSPRNTTVTIESTLTGSHVCRVYLDGSFAYQRTVTLE